MKVFRSELALVSAILPFATALGWANVQNNCPETIYVYSVGSSAGTQQTITTGNCYTEQYHNDPTCGGIAIKICLSDGCLWTGAPQTDFSYTLQGDTVWYDMSDVYGDPFKGKRMMVTATNPKCPHIEWSNGVNPGGSQVHECSSDADITLSLC
ncbi:putative BYS1 domain protein [Rhizodiscina lignyota]|uniref:BYS1 domain protein n=1 Tax=Rhizodiscina lignyota TaxID=1504668 RepID=A0A9P4IDU0_9PEZI|nr:putative BYS1 domain protein [Rhizodiscina lignyota]